MISVMAVMADVWEQKAAVNKGDRGLGALSVAKKGGAGFWKGAWERWYE